MKNKTPEKVSDAMTNFMPGYYLEVVDTDDGHEFKAKHEQQLKAWRMVRQMQDPGGRRALAVNDTAP